MLRSEIFTTSNLANARRGLKSQLFGGPINIWRNRDKALSRDARIAMKEKPRLGGPIRG